MIWTAQNKNNCFFYDWETNEESHFFDNLIERLSDCLILSFVIPQVGPSADNLFLCSYFYYKIVNKIWFVFLSTHGSIFKIKIRTLYFLYIRYNSHFNHIVCFDLKNEILTWSFNLDQSYRMSNFGWNHKYFKDDQYILQIWHNYGVY